jgi:hypothetical protein
MINKNGTAVFNNMYVRGHLHATGFSTDSDLTEFIDTSALRSNSVSAGGVHNFGVDGGGSPGYVAYGSTAWTLETNKRVEVTGQSGGRLIAIATVGVQTPPPPTPVTEGVLKFELVISNGGSVVTSPTSISLKYSTSVSMAVAADNIGASVDVSLIVRGQSSTINANVYGNITYLLVKR